MAMIRWTIGIGAGLLLLLGAPPLFAQPTGTVVGVVEDAETAEPVGWVQVLLEEAGRSIGADAEGRFVLRNVPPGLTTLKAFRIGYEGLVQTVTVPAGDTLSLTLRLAPSPVRAGEVVVEAGRAASPQLTDAALELEGRQLRRNLGTTIAETLEGEPGLSMRSMGPAPARPVLRGLGGERLLVLEDGARTGDLSASSTDHAVVIEPLTAERVEVVRGPAALAYGPNVLGGVVNVARGLVPVARPDALTAGFSAQGQTVNAGTSAGLDVSLPAGPLALRFDGAVRRAADVGTPVGDLENTELETVNAAAGGSWVRPWGYAGAAGSYYASAYGIPGGFVGAHPGGVDIELRRAHVEARGEVVPGLAWAPRLALRTDLTVYEQEEIEKSGSVGAAFNLNTAHASATLHTQSPGLLRKGALGVWGELRRYEAGGFVQTPDATEWTLAAFVYQDLHLGALTLQGGLRGDLRHVVPDVTGPSRLVGDVRVRGFGGVSAAATAMVHPTERSSVGVTLMRSIRMPGIEELFSEGPHLAAYSFEVGNAELGMERGLGAEAFAHLRSERVSGRMAVFATRFSRYIFPRNTGTIDYRVWLPIYQTTAAPARMFGGEGSLTVRPAGPVEFEASASYVRGTFTDTDVPMPFIPPLQGRVGASYQTGVWTFGGHMRAASEQDRIYRFDDPGLGAPEEATDGYAIAGLFASVYFNRGRFLHTLDLVLENATDEVYRDHLSRVKSVMPEPGRNVKLLYKVYF